ncbi:conserved hypothetical protein [Rhodospirillaceae bacterium LM-1]|nr:conserved hypothetical protein [Rhodospirillaceae bacterium LM-1]
MIGAIETAKTLTGGLENLGKDKTSAGAFDAAMAAAQKSERAEEARKSELQSIRDKGFRGWVGEMQIEKLKAELREKVMQAMGLTEEDLAQMAPAIQQILEQKIKEELERQLEEEMRQQQAGKSVQGNRAALDGAMNGQDGSGTAARQVQAPQPAPRQNSPQQKDENGKTCPVIPALAWPGLTPGALF